MEHAQQQREYIHGLLLGVAATVALSFKAIFGKLAFTADHTLTAQSLTLGRLMIGAPVLFLFCLPAIRKSWSSLSKRHWVLLCTMAVFGYAGAMQLSFASISYMDASLSQLIVFIYPAFSVMMVAGIERTMPSQRKISALLATAAGLALVLASDMNFESNNIALGVVLALAAAATYAVYLATNHVLLRDVHTLTITSLSMVVGVFFAALTQLYEQAPILPTTESSWMYAAALGLISGALPFGLIALAQARIGVDTMVILSMLGPALTVLWASFLLDESLSGTQWIGLGAVVLGTFLLKQKETTHDQKLILAKTRS